MRREGYSRRSLKAYGSAADKKLWQVGAVIAFPRLHIYMKILIAEHNVKLVSAMKYIVRQFGFHDIVDTDDGDDALRLLTENQFDFVILDRSLPNVGGVDLTKVMRGQAPHRTTPVILITQENQPEDVLAAIESGVNEYVLKPLDKEVLRAKIYKVLKTLKADVA
jgi:two-component system chemotaxis response regulator CheY